MKPFLVDVPVKINIWIREDCQRRQFEIIKQARPSILFIQSDGGRNEREKEIIAKQRKMFDEEIDWDCTVYKLYEEENLGMYAMGAKTSKFIWDTVDRCILLEDDLIPSVSYFRFCAEMLEKYKDDDRVNVVCGMNHLGVYNDVSSDYFFSRQGSIWGVAMWRRTYEKYYDFAYSDEYTMKLLKQRTKKNKTFWKRIQAYSKSQYYEGHIAGDEFFIEFGMYGQNQLQIIPKYNLISNIGCGADAAHSHELRLLPRGIRKVFNMKTYEIEFPLKHNDYVIPDLYYEKKRNRIMAYNNSVVSFWRSIEYCLYRMFRDDFFYPFKRIAQKLKGDKIEK